LLFPAESKSFNFRELAHLRMTDAIMPKFRGRYRRIDKESVISGIEHRIIIQAVKFIPDTRANYDPHLMIPDWCQSY